MLIRNGESDFSTYYKRLGPFAKLTTSSYIFGGRTLYWVAPR
jgi:hypothetical protein